ncbi:hypothetical protein RJ640_010197 [Escallonia rubra]|uniref:Uncharacterized protein n=1 Tax=Escallonia rubra TaxID=112253 RepID=A0AA88UJL8_9ASTE|nr:hypothetical protein RJ640_010197 [Escallonia rubra]
MKLGRISDDLRKEHKGFREWDLVANRRDRQTILQILIDGRETKAVDVEGQPLPTLVYLAREKRPKFHHNFKAGALNALLRVSSRISDSPIVLTVDCDMYSNNSESVRNAMCFFMDEERGHDIAFVQYPQQFDNITKNDIYSSSLRVIMEMSNPWTLAFAYVMIAKYAYSLGEFLLCGGTVQGWWNDQRMWVYKRLTSYLFGFLETIFKSIGFAKSGFVVTAKTSEEDVSSRYEKEVMEFGAASPMFNILATVALVNLLGFVAGVKRVILNMQNEDFNLLALQIILCGLVVLINLPLYQGLFFRKDNGRMPSSIRYQSILVAVFAYLVALY